MKMIKHSRFVFFVFAFLSIFLQSPATQAEPAHYLVIGIDRVGQTTLLYHSLVNLQHPLSSLTKEELIVQQDNVKDDQNALTVRLSKDGMILFQAIVSPKWQLRGDFHGEWDDGEQRIVGHKFSLDQTVVTVRVPVISGTTLELEGRMFSKYDLDLLVASADKLALSGRQAELTQMQGISSGNSGNRVDLLIMGDGYAATQSGKFASDAQDLLNSFFSITPYLEYANFVNTTTLFTVSAESGADHPPYDASCNRWDPSCCADPAAQTDPLAGSYVDTAFNARYCGYNSHRLLVVDNALVMAAAASQPDWDKILLLVNDSTYGGSGGMIPVASTNYLSVDVMRHEYGHSFTGLADEYESPYPGYPGCSDISGTSKCEANVTDQTEASLIKWTSWVEDYIPIPTPESSGYSHHVGLFEGARYLSSGMYRPRETQCLMRSLMMPFCEICTQSYILKLYAGGWGVPANGIEIIEPDSANPPAGQLQTIGSVDLSVDLLEPIGGPPVDVEWRVDDVVQSGEKGDSFTFSPPQSGSFTVEVIAKDFTSLVHPEMAGASMESHVQWTVDATTESQDCYSSDVILDNLNLGSGESFQCQADQITTTQVTTQSGSSMLLEYCTQVIMLPGLYVAKGSELQVIKSTQNCWP